MAEKKSGWGGPWTEKKLEAFGKYVWSYLKILKSQPQWKTIYFDGFAGSGDRKHSNAEGKELYKQLSLTPDEENVYKGAAERVLTLDDGFLFDFHYFVDSSEQSLTKLRTKLEPLSNSKRTSLNFKPGDCNKWLAELATALKKKKYAALVLLDPFGMQINWGSIAALKGTRSDIWILVPTGVIINRLLNRNGQLEHLEKLQSDANSWMGPKPMIWAAEIHPYKGKYYYFATFTNQSLKIDTVAENVIERRACHVLVSDKPHGPYVLMKDLHIYQRINQRWMELFGLKMEDLI